MQKFIFRTPEGEPCTVQGTPTFNFASGISNIGNFAVTEKNPIFKQYPEFPNLNHVRFTRNDNVTVVVFPDQLGEEKMEKLSQFGITIDDAEEKPTDKVISIFDDYIKRKEDIEAYHPDNDFWLTIPPELVIDPNKSKALEVVDKPITGVGGLLLDYIAVSSLMWSVLKKTRNSLPLNSARGLGGDVIDNSVDATDLVDDPSRNPPQDING